MPDQTTGEESIAKSITEQKPRSYAFQWVWISFLVAYPFFFTLFTFIIVVFVGLGCMKLDATLLLALIGKTAVTDIGIISYVTVTKSLFPVNKDEAI